MKLFVDRVPTRPKDCLFAIHPNWNEHKLPLNCLLMCNYHNTGDAFSRFETPAGDRSCTLERGIPCPLFKTYEVMLWK